MRLPWLLHVVVFFAFVTGCTTLPTAQLVAYTDSFTEVQTAGNAIYDELVEVWPESDRPQQTCGLNDAGFKPCIDANALLNPSPWDPTEPEDIIIRRAALDVIGTYNQLLLDIAEGRPTGIITARLNELSGLAGALAPLLPGLGSEVVPIVDQITKITKAVENLQSQGQAARSLTSAKPDIDELMAFLIEDAPAVYTVYLTDFRGFTRDEIRELEKQANIARVQGLTAANAGDTEKAEAFQKQSEELFAKAKEARANEASGALTGDGKDKVNAFASAIEGYILALDKTRDSLTLLVQAVELSSPNNADLIAEIARRVAETKLIAETIQTDLQDLRALD